jgi:cytidylate kinase
MRIAIDGPAGAGKTTLGRALAQALGCLFVNTGRMYRAVAWGLRRGLALSQMQIEVTPHERLLLNGRDITDELDTPEIDEKASQAATQPEVRAWLVALQREIAQKSPIVMEGRDIATVVMPEADVKIFLTASVEERARRRFVQRGGRESYEQILEKLRERDARDRAGFGRLQTTPETLVIQTDGRTLEEVVQEALRRVQAAGAGSKKRTPSLHCKPAQS